MFDYFYECASIKHLRLNQEKKIPWSFKHWYSVSSLKNSHVAAFPTPSNTHTISSVRKIMVCSKSIKYLGPPLLLSLPFCPWWERTWHYNQFFLNTIIYQQFSLKKYLISEEISSTLWCTVTKWLLLHIIITEKKLL